MARVLYLDDEQPLVFLVTRLLTDLGHRASGFTSAVDALNAFKASQQGFDLVLTDMSMPRTSGLEFAQQILAIDPRTVVVIATGCDDPNWADHARASGVRAVIEKPVTVEAMESALGPLLGLS